MRVHYLCSRLIEAGTHEAYRLSAYYEGGACGYADTNYTAQEPALRATVLRGLFLLCAILFSGYALVMYFTGLALPGFTTVIILELLIGGVLMISVGITGTYIAQIYQEVKYRPRYVVAETLTSHRDHKLSRAPENM